MYGSRMAELPQKTQAPRELLDRIARLETRSTDLDADLRALSDAFRKAVKVFGEFG